MKPILLTLFFVLMTVTGVTGSAKPKARTASATSAGSALDRLRAPSGFKISLVALLPGARSITQAKDNTKFGTTLFVGTGGFSNPKDVVYRLKDWNNNGHLEPDEVDTPVTKASNPNGVAFRKGTLYVAEINRIMAYPNILLLPRGAAAPAPVILPQTFPSDRSHGWKFIRFAPAPHDNWLYVPIGANCNICKPASPFGTLYRVNVEGSERELVASGIRNTVGFDFHPVSKNLWFTENGRDGWGNDRPPDELNEVQKPGQHFGFPYCYGKAWRDDSMVFDSVVKSCDDTVKPIVDLAPHTAALGMRFYVGSMFPAAYKNQVFIAEHGSWNRSQKNGYRVAVARMKSGTWIYEPFITGWLDESTQTHYGRPVDVEELPDGSLLVSDDGSGADPDLDGALYRVEH